MSISTSTSLGFPLYDDPRGYRLHNWPNKHTLNKLGTVYVTIVCSAAAKIFENKPFFAETKIASATMFSMIALNIPLRLIGMHHAYSEKNTLP